MIRAGSHTPPTARAAPRAAAARTASSVSKPNGEAGFSEERDASIAGRATRFRSRISASAGSAGTARIESTSAGQSRAREGPGAPARGTRCGSSVVGAGATDRRASGRALEVLTSAGESTAAVRVGSGTASARCLRAVPVGASAGGDGATTFGGATTSGSTTTRAAAATGCGLGDDAIDGSGRTPAGSPPATAGWACGSSSLVAGALTATSDRSAGDSATGSGMGSGAGSGTGAGRRAGSRTSGST